MGLIDMKLARALSAWMFAALSVTACSCGLLPQGTTEEINVASDPPGVTVTLDDGETKVTPFSITVPRQKDLQFHFSKPGYQSADVVDNSQVEFGYMTADFIPLMLPWSFDAAAGAGFAHQQARSPLISIPWKVRPSDVSAKTNAPLPPVTPPRSIGIIDHFLGESIMSLRRRVPPFAADSYPKRDFSPIDGEPAADQRMRLHDWPRRSRVSTHNSSYKTRDCGVAARECCGNR